MGLGDAISGKPSTRIAGESRRDFSGNGFPAVRYPPVSGVPSAYPPDSTPGHMALGPDSFQTGTSSLRQLKPLRRSLVGQAQLRHQPEPPCDQMVLSPSGVSI